MKHRISKAHDRIFQPPHERFITARGRHLVARRAMVNRDHYADRVPQYPLLKRVLILIAVVLLAQGIFQVPLFQLKNISVTGLEYIPEERVDAFIASELHRRRLLFFRNDNYFLFAQRRFTTRLEERFYVKVVKIAKRFPHDLSVELSERISAFVVQASDQYIQLDTSGKQIGEVQGPLEKQSVIADERSDRTTPISREYLERITSIKKQWEHDIPDIVIEKFHLTDDARTVNISTHKNFSVYLDPSKDMVKQLQRLQLFLADTSLQHPREYIDLRFDESLYIK